MSKSFTMPKGAKSAPLSKTSWGNGRSHRLEEGATYALPTLSDAINFVEHEDPDWTSIVLDQTCELALSSVCRTFLDKDGNQHTCSGSFAEVAKSSANKDSLAHLLVRLLSRGDSVKVNKRTDFVILWDNTPQLKSVYNLEIVGAPVPVTQLQAWEASQIADAHTNAADSAPID